MNKWVPLDNVTLWVMIGFWPLWIVWELVALYLRGRDPNVDVISMSARDRAYQLSALAFAWGSLSAHFFANWRNVPSWVTPYGTVTFFALIALVLAWDVSLWRTPYESLSWWVRLVRFPGTMLFLGLLNGAFVSPQSGSVRQPF